MKTHLKMWSLQTIHHLGFFAALFILEPWHWLGAIAAFVIFQVLGANIGLHRFLAHQSFRTTRFNEILLIGLSNLIGLGSSVSWIAVHRYHHLTSDSESDCHSPQHLPISRIITGRWKDLPIQPQVLKSILKDPIQRFFHFHYFKIHLIWMAILILVGHKFFLALYCVPAFLIFYTSYAVVIGCHKWGYRNFETPDKSHNNIFVSLVTLGEGWHNNHHSRQLNIRQGVKPWEWDPNAWIINTFFVKN